MSFPKHADNVPELGICSTVLTCFIETCGSSATWAWSSGRETERNDNRHHRYDRAAPQEREQQWLNEQIGDRETHDTSNCSDQNITKHSHNLHTTRSQSAAPITTSAVASSPQGAAVFLRGPIAKAPIEMRQKGLGSCGLQVTSRDAYPKRAEQRQNHSTRHIKRRNHLITIFHFVFRVAVSIARCARDRLATLAFNICPAGRTAHHDHSKTTLSRTITRYLNPCHSLHDAHN
jgi:hypothetical protein